MVELHYEVTIEYNPPYLAPSTLRTYAGSWSRNCEIEYLGVTTPAQPGGPSGGSFQEIAQKFSGLRWVGIGRARGPGGPLPRLS